MGRTKAEAWLAYRARILPSQLARARKRVLHLEREAARLGLQDLLEKEQET